MVTTPLSTILLMLWNYFTNPYLFLFICRLFVYVRLIFHDVFFDIYESLIRESLP